MTLHLSPDQQRRARSLFWPRCVAENYVSIASKKPAKGGGAPTKRNILTGAGSLHCQRGRASLADRQSLVNPFGKEGREHRRHIRWTAARRCRRKERVRWHWRSRARALYYHERDHFSFIFQPPSSLRATRKRRTDE